MKKFLWIILILLLVVIAGGFLFYKLYLPKMVAEAIVSEESPEYLPSFARDKIQKIQPQINKAAERVIQQIHKSNISIDHVIQTVDNTDAESVQSAINDLKTKE